MIKIALRLTVAWIFLSLALAALWVLLLEVSRRFAGKAPSHCASADARRDPHRCDRSEHRGNVRGSPDCPVPVIPIKTRLK